MNTDWSEFGPAPAGEDPLTVRGGTRTARYPDVGGAGFPKGWSVSEWVVDFEDTPFYEEFLDHRDMGMELTVLLSDYHAMRGSGKTTLSIRLARKLDQTDEGLTPEKVTNSGEEFIDAYVRHAKGSGLVFDEAEGDANARDAMTNVNKEINEKVSVGRVGEKYSVWNMPDIGQIDKEVRKLAHYWVLVQRRGRARVYELSNDPFEGQVYTKPICNLEWNALPDSDPVYQRLDEHKWDKLEGEGKEYIPADEHREAVEKAEESGRKEVRNNFIYEAQRRNLLTQQEIAELDFIDVGRRRVGQIHREMKSEEAAEA